MSARNETLLPRVRFRKGEVVIAGAGPGSLGHTTLLALAYLRRSEAILYDRLADGAALRRAPPGAERIYVGKSRGTGVEQAEINEQLLRLARAGKRVLRWKGGDPFVFGRGAEEVEFLRGHGVRVTVVPGVSSVTGALTSAGIPLVHRELSGSFAVFSGEVGKGRIRTIPLASLAASAETLVGVMPVRGLPGIVAELLTVRPKDEPAALVERGGRTGERTVRATLGEIVGSARREGVRAPALLVVGQVAGWTGSGAR